MTEKKDHEKDEIETRDIKETRADLDRKKPDLPDLEEREKILEEREEHLTTEREAFLKEVKEIEKTKSALSQRENELRLAEIKRDEGFQDDRRELDKKIAEKRAASDAALAKLREERLSELDAEIDRLRKARFAEIEKQCAEEHSFRHAADEAARQDFESYKAAEMQNIQEIQADLDRKKQELGDKEQELSAKADDLEFEKRRYKGRTDSLSHKEEAIEETVRQRIAEREKSFAYETAVKERECERLRDELRSLRERRSMYEELERKLGGENPAMILQELTVQEEKLKEKEKEFLEYTKQEQTKIRKEFDDQNKEKKHLEEECTRLSEENRNLKAGQQDAQAYEARIEELYSERTSLTNQKLALETEVNRMRQDLERFHALYKNADDEQTRVRAIEKPYFSDPRRRRNESEIIEMDWIDGIRKSCADHGFVFPRRLLYAFHTALKIAEWSSITVLAGVSGTGKSKLPELYSHFGGLNFLSLAVQPNWDSKESMLGFFNTIEGTYDAQPVLQFLVQTQKEQSADYPAGFKDALNIVLLDEMNLANVELYFAEFLSKLEERSTKAEGQEPDISVKIGSGLDYRLKLGRNVLWVGTMNQDETTKSLSDKVLDRGIVINFPRPKKLVSRKTKPMSNRVDLLPKTRWENWKATQDIFEANAERLDEYRSFVEEVNASLAKAGLAIGFRVWQSIEQYMVNYPPVLDEFAKVTKAGKENDDAEKKKAQNRLDAAFKDAFEDQLAQKVMPKLRGVETSGDQKKDCLEPIKKLIESKNYEKLVADFNNATKFGNGQFIWNSSEYLLDSNDPSNG
jgi:hypothetical protein